MLSKKFPTNKMANVPLQKPQGNPKSHGLANLLSQLVFWENHTFIKKSQYELKSNYLVCFNLNKIVQVIFMANSTSIDFIIGTANPSPNHLIGSSDEHIYNLTMKNFHVTKTQYPFFLKMHRSCCSNPSLYNCQGIIPPNSTKPYYIITCFTHKSRVK